MKTSLLRFPIAFALLFALGAIAILQSGCLRDKCTSLQSYTRFDPIYKTIPQLRADLSIEAAHPLKNTGKIYVFEQYLFINEIKEGIHVFDNSDPAAPKALAFWRIPGNVDIAIRDHYLYADQYMDLLTIDISNLQTPVQVNRKPQEFGLMGYDPNQGYIIDYIQTEVTQELDCNDWRSGGGFFLEGDVLYVNTGLFSSSSSPSTNVASVTGTGGSFARFAIQDAYLYTIDKNILRAYTLGNPVSPQKIDSVYAGWNIETLFPWKNKLFIGSPNGVFIYNNATAGHPIFESSFTHASGCDPVICDEKFAYVTIHDGTTCNGTNNQLDVIGIDQLPSTNWVATYSMKHPMGLALQGDYLYLCDDGLKVYNKTNPGALQQKAHLKNIDTYDAIALSDSLLLIVGKGGLYQFDISSPASPEQISLIPTEN